jgi:hypothetical protein
MSTASDFMSENRGDFPESFKFRNVGDAIAGTLVEEPRRFEGTDLNGQPQTNWIFEVETDAGDRWSVWAPVGKAISKKIASAMQEAGVTSFTVGDRLAVVFTGLGEPSKPGYSPPKLYDAKYEAAKPSGVSASDLL